MNLLPSLTFKLLFFFILCLLSLQAKSLNLTLEEQQWIIENPDITLGSDAAWPPYDFVNSQGLHDGISADIIEIIRQKTGLNIQIKSGRWSEIISNMKQGRLDGLVCAVQTPEREAYLNFTLPYTTMPLGIFVRTENKSISSLENLKNKLVAVNEASYLHEWLATTHPEISLYLTTSNKKALNAVSFGHADAYVGNLAVATYVIQQNYLTNLKLIAKADGIETKTAIAVDKTQPILMSIIEKSLKDIKPSVLREINEHWYARSRSPTIQGKLNTLNLTLKERSWIANYGEVKVAVEPDWPPFDFVDSSKKPKGLSIEYLKLIAQKTGLKLKFTTDVWPQNLKDLENKETDLLPAGVKNETREKYALFSEPYFEANNYFFIRDDLNVSQIQELNGKIVAIPKGFAGIEFIQTHYPKITVLEVGSMQDAIEAVIQNRAQMLFSLYPVASYFLKKTGVNSIMPFKATREGLQNIRFIIRDDLPELQSIVNKGLAAMSVSEKLAIDAKWFTAKSQPKLELTRSERDWMNSFGPINVVSTRNWAPFNFMDDSQTLVGLSLDYLALVAQKTGLKLNVTADDWTNNLSNLEHKKIDLLPAAGKSKDRARYALFSDPYFKAKDYFFIRDDLHVERLSDLDGKTVALPKGYASIPVIQRDYPNILIIETASVQASIEAVLQNKAQVLYGLYPTISYMLRKTGVNTIMPFKVTQGSQNLHFMVRKDIPELASILNKGLAAITEDEKHAIDSRWLGKQKSFDYGVEFELTKAERDWLQQNSSVSFTGDPDWLPFEAFDPQGNYLGIVAEFLKSVENKIPLKFEMNPVSSWQEALNLADNKAIDVISGDVDDAHLAQNYRPIESYITVPVVMVMRGEVDFVSFLSDLKGKSLGIVKGYGYTRKFLTKYEGYHFIEFDSTFELLESVSTGKVDVALLSLPVASYLIKQNSFHLLSIVGKTTLDMQLTLFVSKEQPELYELLNRVMKKVKEKRGEEILNAWTKLNFASKVDYGLIIRILLIALFFIGVVFYWNLKLNREVKQRKAIEQQLEVEKNKFKHIFDKAADGHLIFQRNKFVECNQAALDLLGLDNKETLFQQNIVNWSPEYQPDGAHSAVKRKEFIQRCFNQGMQRFDWVLKDVYGHTFWVDVVYTSIPYLGKPAIYISWRDKTKQKVLEDVLKQNEEQIKLVIDSIPLIVLITNLEGDVLSANRKALDDYNVDLSDVSALNITNFYQHSSDRDEITRCLQQKGRVEQKIVTMKDVQGQAREMMLSIIPIKYHKKSALLTISVDLTERILVEKQLKEAMAKAKAANQSKTEFLANMSHEIRTPMNAILGFTALLNEQVKEPRLKSFIHTIQSAGNTLLMLINDILDLSKIEAGKMTLHQTATNPSDLFKEVGDIFTMNIQKKGLDFYIDIASDIPESLLLDPVRLRQVLFNLLGNAVKFTDRGSIKLSVKSVNAFKKRSKIDLLIKVEDTGIGISLDQHKRIFNAFEQQAGQDLAKFGGTGLGLSITKRLVRMMNGNLSVESTPNQGSTFTVLLEKVDVASVHVYNELESSVSFNAKTIQFKPATVLVVDDVLNNRELICQNFMGSELTIIQAENGQEAIDCYKSNAIDLIIMDIRMPVLNGYEAAKAIKSLNSDIPIIALTASVMLDEFEKINRAYFDDYLRKPVLRNDLVQTLSQFLEFDQIRSDEMKEAEGTVAFSKEHLPEALLAPIKNELLPLYNTAVSSNSVEDIKTFAKKVADLAGAHNNDVLDRFASQLLEKVDSFDIAGMQYLLKQAEFLVVL